METIKGCRKVFMTGQAKLNSNHYSIKYVDSFLSAVVLFYKPTSSNSHTSTFLLLLLFVQSNTLWAFAWVADIFSSSGDMLL